MFSTERARVQRELARQFYLSYCMTNDHDPSTRPSGYAPNWAHEYASIAVDILGYDDDTIDRLSEAAQ